MSRTFAIALPLVIATAAGMAAGDEPKPVDLAGLQNAVKAASKRGANVTEVGKALAAVEKLVAKGWVVPKADAKPPAELAALRDAVETAAAKGEDVDAVRKELDAVEKAMLGRTLAAAKADPAARKRSVLVFNSDGVTIVIDGGGAPGDTFWMRTENGAFHFKANRRGVEYYATGLFGKNGPEDVLGQITDGDKKHDFDKLDKVPEKYRATLDQLLSHAVDVLRDRPPAPPPPGR